MSALFNLPLATLLLHTLQANPHLHDRTVWADPRPDGVAYCIAGWTVTLAGAVWGSIPGMVSWRGQWRSVPVLARELLGLTPLQANALIYDVDERQAVDLLALWITEARDHQRAQLARLEQELERCR
ncbi:hypothetical protein IU500_13395 [Nocardia terpenica]|uniref:hypothetical protein n=1 Tax=Nocardia terpenica TaxID=455432 RepID=UPI001896174C|nr:hypothetical protein [Nocardia terpenica]MBF6062828.1 hypothetical protein [Nocardia terpenica]MBF6105037.1 hypothetical protein [Nocardia terpenica]MBF6112526.1 hypothetical protein [Nocardia terpenica]MBF6118765.1 hypothetical protein [Nocardia terpenica]MBF6154234.1 hypothetical protein [Nocardia terpenica]